MRFQTETFPIPDVEIAWVPEMAPLDVEPLGISSVIRQKGDQIEVAIPEVARYRLTGGKKVEITPEPEASPESVWFFLKATPFGILAMQRGELPIHASAVVPPWGGGALLVAGDSGAGKSTTAGALIQRGWKILNDDLSRTAFRDDGAFSWPGFHSMKLSHSSAKMLGLSQEQLPRTPGIKEKYYWDLEGVKQTTSVAGMLVLSNPTDEFKAPARLGGLELLQVVYQQTFRPFLVAPLGFQKVHFALVSQFAKTVPCFRLEGNHSRSLEELCDVIEWCFRGVQTQAVDCSRIEGGAR